MQFSFVKPSLVALSLAVIPCLGAGCGTSEQKYTESGVPSIQITSKQRIKSWLTSVAANGEIDSGVSVIHEEIEKLPTDSGINVPAVLKEFDTLSSSKPADVKKIAAALAAQF